MAVAQCKSESRPDTAYFAFVTTRDPEEGHSPISRWMSKAYDYEDQTASIVGIHVPPGSRVLRLRHEVSEAFTGVTAMIVGDGVTDNGWIETGVITPGTAGDFIGDLSAAFEAQGGKFYQDGDTIDVEFTGVATAGSGIVFIEVISYAEEVAAE